MKHNSEAHILYNLVTNCLIFGFRIHHHQIVTNQMLIPTLDKLRLSSTSTVEVYKVCMIESTVNKTLCAVLSTSHIET